MRYAPEKLYIFFIAKTIYMSGLFSIRYTDGGVTLYFFGLAWNCYLSLL